jgi:hypothetical protein
MTYADGDTVDMAEFVQSDAWDVERVGTDDDGRPVYGVLRGDVSLTVVPSQWEIIDIFDTKRGELVDAYPPIGSDHPTTEVDTE